MTMNLMTTMKINNITPGDLVKVIWVDPETSSGWFEEPSYKLENVVTIGYYVGIKNNMLCCATTYHKGTEAFADEMQFPCGCVLAVVRLMND